MFETSIRDPIARIDTDQIVLPAMQRPFVWLSVRTARFVDSLLRRFPDVRELRRELRLHYPVEFVTELRTLLEYARQDLPPAGAAIYNPDVGGMVGDIRVKANGDLLLDDILLELKVSKLDEPRFEDVIQLLGYAALDGVRGNERIKRSGIYNPRWRILWIEPVETIAQILGWASFPGFCAWFDEAVSGVR